MLAWITALALAAPLQAGDAAPPLEGIQWVAVPEGSPAPHSWADLEGKVVVIDFWATWCGPCVASWPEMERLARAAGDDVVVMAVSTEASPRVKGFLDRRGGPVTQLVGAESEAVSEAWGALSLPMYGVVGPDGRVFAIRGDLPTKEILEAARSGAPPEAGRSDEHVSAQSFGPSAGSARDSWSSLGTDTVRGHALDAPGVLELASGLITEPRHRYDVELPEGRWDIDLAVPPNQDRETVALARIAEAWDVRIARERITVDALVIDGTGITLPVSDNAVCQPRTRGSRLDLDGCGPELAAMSLEGLLGTPVVIEGLSRDPIALSLAWDKKDPVAAVTASLREQGFVVRTEPRTLSGLVVSAR